MTYGFTSDVESSSPQSSTRQTLKSVFIALIGRGWLPVRIVRASFVVCACMMIVSLVLPYQGVEVRRNGDSPWRQVDTDVGLQVGGAVFLAMIGLVILLGLFLVSSSHRWLRRIGRATPWIIVLGAVSIVVLFIVALSSDDGLFGDDFGEVLITEAIVQGVFGRVPLERTVGLVGSDISMYGFLGFLIIWFLSRPIYIIDWFRRRHRRDESQSPPPPQWLAPAMTPVFATPTAAPTVSTPQPPAIFVAPAPAPLRAESDWDLV